MYKDKSSGDTIIRKVVTPSNPKTERQTIQRIVMHTVANAYSFFKELCDHSFEGMAQGRDTMGYFIKQNVQLTRDAIARMQSQGVLFYEMYNFLPLGRRGFVANQYQISMGSLPSVECSLENEVAVAYMQGIGADDNTYEAVINKLGLKRGDQLTFLVVINRIGDLKELKFARIILDPTDPDTHLQAPLSTPFIVDNAVNFPSVRNENEGNLFFHAPTADGLPFGQGDNVVEACAVIVSRKGSNDSWMRSTTYLNYSEGRDWSLGDCIDMAKDGSTTIYTPSEYYLNNAGQGGGVAAATGEDSGNSGNTPAVTVASASLNGQNMIAGTRKDINMNPIAAVNVVTAFSGNATGSVKIVKVSDSSVASTAQISGDSATNTFTPVANAVYQVVYNLGGEDVNTGYTFKVTDDDDVIPGQG